MPLTKKGWETLPYMDSQVRGVQYVIGYGGITEVGNTHLTMKKTFVIPEFLFSVQLKPENIVSMEKLISFFCLKWPTTTK